VQQTVDRALTFLVQDAAKWRTDRGCATCHHGAMTVWALSEAQSRGYVVPAETLADNVKWTKDLFVAQFSKPRDPRWGFNFVSLPGIYLSLMSQTLPILSRDEVNRLAVHLARHQEADGAWLVPPPNPNTSPPTWESPETIALWALLAWEPHVPADANEAATDRAARERAVAWLANTKPTETTQALSLRLLLDIRAGLSAGQLHPKIEQLGSRQNADGGWSQLQDLPSDAYATGQMLWVLSFAGIPPDHPLIRRAVSFLVTSQQETGAWLMTPRSLPGADPSKKRNPMPTVYFGTAWATLGLVRFVPPALDTATRQKRAVDYLRTFSGIYEVDENIPEKPIVSIKFSYEVDDEQVANLAQLLTGSPHLKSLQFKSPAITDATAAHLKKLPQLRSLSLEQAALTDTGLAVLKSLTGLEELNLKGTKVTDAGVEDFQRAMPKAKVQR
jgi:N-acyl-D-amino-acid deacylase